MRIILRRMTSAGEITSEPIDMERFFKLEVEIDGQEFALSEKDGALDVHSTSGMRLLVELVASNWLAIRSFYCPAAGVGGDMTNEQLLVLLSSIADEFNDALEDAELALTAQRPRVRERVHQPPQICLNWKCEHPEHFQEIEFDAPTPELDVLRLFGNRLAERIDLLRGERS